MPSKRQSSDDTQARRDDKSAPLAEASSTSRLGDSSGERDATMDQSAPTVTRSPIPGCYLFGRDRTPVIARFPVVDAHNHLCTLQTPEQSDSIIETMDQVGVVSLCDLTGNSIVVFEKGGYYLAPRDYAVIEGVIKRHPRRIYAFTTSTFGQPADKPLCDDLNEFSERTVRVLHEHVARGARGLKIAKELGMAHRDSRGRLINLDDPRLQPIWTACAELGVPVLMHQSDPYGFFEAVTPENEHCDSLRVYPAWSFASPAFPRKQQLLERRDAVIEANPATTFILPHVANFPENLEAVDRLLRRFPNVMIDISARCDELGRQPYTARRFLIEHQDRVLFGTDMPPSVDMYRFHFRFFETDDEYFVPPDYDGTFARHRWKVFGLHLPDEALQKLYCANALRTIPGLADDLADLPAATTVAAHGEEPFNSTAIPK